MSEADLDVELEAELTRLRQEYGRSLPRRVTEVEQALQRLREGLPGAADELRLLSHRIRGTAGSYGFTAITDAAGLVEDAIRPHSKGAVVPPDVMAALDLYLRKAHELARAASQGEVSPAGGSAIDDTRPLDRVLVADDDPDFLALVRELARRHAVELVPARTPEETLDAVRIQRPDAVIVDVGLTSNDGGYDTARRLRELPGCEHVPVAFISGVDSLEARVAAAHAGGSLFLHKPLDAASFGDALQQLLSQRPTRPRVMLIDDDPDFHARVALTLNTAGLELLALRDTSDLLNQLDRFRPDLLLLDVVMPKISGLDICRMLRTAPVWRDLPILFLTSQMSAEDRVSAFRAGADDYLVKPVVPEELLARVEVRLERARLVQERAERDALTGVLLRRPFMARLGACLSDAARREAPVSLCLIDVDHFKKVNDTHGHLAGDRVLAVFGRLLSTRFRAADIRSRWGGEEFMLCFPGEASQTTTAIVERLLEEVRGLSFEGEQGEQFSVTFSAGVSQFPDDGADAQTLIRVADRRLYVAKHGGRNRVVREG